MGVNDYGGVESWQGGPAYYYNNISGNPPIGKRDAGAIESGEKACNLNVEPTVIDYEMAGGTDIVAIEAATGW